MLVLNSPWVGLLVWMGWVASVGSLLCVYVLMSLFSIDLAFSIYRLYLHLYSPVEIS